ncbi:MAG: recombinase family protein [Nocardioides sp.]
MTKRPVVLYARISVTTEESVSVARQIASGRKYAAARGWRVVGEFVDDGVSATHNKPERRPGWRSLLAFQVPFEAVVVWKVDRLARRVIDFLHAAGAWCRDRVRGAEHRHDDRRRSAQCGMTGWFRLGRPRGCPGLMSTPFAGAASRWPRGVGSTR